MVELYVLVDELLGFEVVGEFGYVGRLVMVGRISRMVVNVNIEMIIFGDILL